MKYFSNKKRPFHLDPFPLERLVRFYARPELSAGPSMPVSDFSQHGPESLAHSMAILIAMMDAVRGGKIVNGLAEIPTDEQEHSRHFKAAGYYFDASTAGITKLTLFMAGGIGLTPLMAMGHQLYTLGKECLFHYSA